MPALAQEQVCGQREIIGQQLETRHGEFRQSVGLQDNMIVVEVFASVSGHLDDPFHKAKRDFVL